MSFAPLCAGPEWRASPKAGGPAACYRQENGTNSAIDIDIIADTADSLEKIVKILSTSPKPCMSTTIAGPGTEEVVEHDRPSDESITRSKLTDPIQWSKTRKWFISGFSCFLAFLVAVNALSISSAAQVINDEFGISDASFPNSYWTVTSWNFGAAISPLVGLPLMETFGMRVSYLSCYILFIIFVIPQALARNYATLIVSRFFAGSFASLVQNGVVIQIGDLWVGEDNSSPVVAFILAYLLGFTFGPTYGSAILQYLQWRWIFYIQLIICGIFLPFAFFLVKETRASVLLAAEEKKNPSRRTASNPSVDKPPLTTLLYECTVRPARLFLTEPVVFFFTFWSGLAVGNVFLASQSIAQTYAADHAFDAVSAGYIQAALSVGEIIGALFCLLQPPIYHAFQARNNGVPVPEARLALSILFSPLALAGGLFIYAWTSYPSVPWIAPTLGLALVGAGIMVVVQAVLAYIQDAYGVWAGSAIGAVACSENLFAAFLPLATQKMYTTLGFQWASSLLAFFALALSVAPVVLFIKGPQIRARSKFMQTT